MGTYSKDVDKKLEKNLHIKLLIISVAIAALSAISVSFDNFKKNVSIEPANNTQAIFIADNNYDKDPELKYNYSRLYRQNSLSIYDSANYFYFLYHNFTDVKSLYKFPAWSKGTFS